MVVLQLTCDCRLEKGFPGRNKIGHSGIRSYAAPLQQFQEFHSSLNR